MLGCKDSGEKNMINSGHVRSSLLVVGNRNEADTHNHFRVVQFRMGKNDSRLSRMGRPQGKRQRSSNCKGKAGGTSGGIYVSESGDIMENKVYEKE